MTAPRRVGFLFPGHGAEVPRMGLALAECNPVAARLLDHAGDVGDFDARSILRRGGDRLSDTRMLQPIMTAVLLGIVEALRSRGVVADLALGHSLGQLSAWSSLGGVTPEAAIELGAVRGRALSRVVDADREFDGAMLALPPMPTSTVESALDDGRTVGSVDIALHNAPERWVLSGERRALMRIAERFGGAFVPTSGAWHSRRFGAARFEFEAFARTLTILPTPSLVSDGDGALLGDRDVVAAFLDQVDGPVDFAAAMTTLAQLEPTDLVLIGPAKVSRGLVRENWSDRGVMPDVRVWNAEGPTDIDELARVLG